MPPPPRNITIFISNLISHGLARKDLARKERVRVAGRGPIRCGSVEFSQVGPRAFIRVLDQPIHRSGVCLAR